MSTSRARRGAGPVVVAVIGALVGLSACAGPTAPGTTSGAATESPDRPVVLTTFTVLADIARNVAGEHLRVESITKPGAEVHHYEPTPSDLRLAGEADLVLDNGLGLELWFEQFVADLDVPHVVVSEGVEVVGIAGTEAPNPHAWMSPLNVQRYADTIAQAFAELDPGNAADYSANALAYRGELQVVQDELVARLSVLPQSQRALVTCEGAFSYLARDAGLHERYLWPVNAEQQATPRQIAATIEFVRANDVPAVFCESTVSDRAMRQVVEATDATFGGVLYVDSLSDADGPVSTYLDLIRHDVDVIVGALTAGSQ